MNVHQNITETREGNKLTLRGFYSDIVLPRESIALNLQRHGHVFQCHEKSSDSCYLIDAEWLDLGRQSPNQSRDFGLHKLSSPKLFFFAIEFAVLTVHVIDPPNNAELQALVFRKSV